MRVLAEIQGHLASNIELQTDIFLTVNSEDQWRRCNAYMSESNLPLEADCGEIPRKVSVQAGR